MTKQLDQQYADTMFEQISKIYYKSLFLKNNFDVYFSIKNFKINDLLLNLLTQNVYQSIEQDKLEVLLRKYEETKIINDIKISLKEIFDYFNSKFESTDEFLDLPYILDKFPCERKSTEILFQFDRYKNDLYIEQYLRVVDNNTNPAISLRDYTTKNVCRKTDFVSFLENDTEIQSLTNIYSPFTSIKQGIRLVYLVKNEEMTNNLNIDVLKQNSFYKEEKCWFLQGRNSAQQQQNSIVHFPLEVCRAETTNFLTMYGNQTLQKLKNTQLNNQINKELLESLISNNDYKKFFKNIVPTQLINIAHYAYFKKLSQMFRDVIKGNNLFTSNNTDIDEEIFKIMNDLLNYKEFVK